MSALGSYLLITVCLLHQLIPVDGNSPEGEAQCSRPSITDTQRISEDKKYYNKGEEIRVQCIDGYYTSTDTIRCDNPDTPREWTPPIDSCRALCRKPEETIMKMDPEKTFYNIGDTVTVNCSVGYVPSYPSVRCVHHGFYINWDNLLECIALCRKPEETILKMDPEKTFYNIGDTLTVNCPVGYRPSPSSIRCVDRGTSIEWDNHPECEALCRKPDWTMVKMDPEKTFYDIGDTVTVNCPVGFHPTYPSVQCVDHNFNLDWNNPPECAPLCRKPDWTMVKLDPEKTFYDIGEVVTVNCPAGFQNPYSIECVKRGTSIRWDISPQCKGFCEKPTIGNMSSFYVNKKHYFNGESIEVKCKSGYYPTSEKMTCENPRTSQEWTPPTVTCIAQCKKPTIDHVDSLSIDKEYYKKGDRITIQCKSGYYPTSRSMTCNNPHASPEWIPPTATCIGVTMTDWRVTVTSISAQISCTPQCPQTWRFTVECCPSTGYYGVPCRTFYGKGGTFTDLQPTTEYNIHVKLNTEQQQYNLVNKVIWTADSVPGQPEIVKVPSMKNNTIRWRFSKQWGLITGFQMNISAWRDYNVSFAVDESLQFPPNVTEYKIPLQYGTNYTITLRAVISHGVGEVTTENIETDIGDPPLHMEKTIHDGTLQLHPVPNPNGPISSYEIIVFGGQEGNSTKECLNFKNTPYNIIWSPSRYTAAVLPAETLTRPRTFTLGDDHHYNGFHNAPLIPNHNYTVYIRVTSRWKHVETSSCAFAGVTEGVTGGCFIPVLSGSSLGIIIGFLVLILLALVGLTVVLSTPWMKRRILRGKKKAKAENNISIQDADYQSEYSGGTEDRI